VHLLRTEVLVQEQGRGKKGHCPKCKHLLVVPMTTKGRPAISPDKEPMPDRSKPRVPEWDKDTRSLPGDASDILVELYKESFRPFIPTYDKLSLFLMVVTLILLCATNIKVLDQMRNLIHRFTTDPKYRQSLIEILIFYAPFLFLVLIIPRGKIDFKRWIMLGFAVLTNAGAGIISGLYVIKTSAVHSWLLIFPIWNIINGVLMLLMVSLRVIDEECISERKASLVQIILGLVAVLTIFIFCNYVFKLHWAVTFSICIVYTTSFDRALRSVFSCLEVQEE
jgi:hypothetical protein